MRENELKSNTDNNPELLVLDDKKKKIVLKEALDLTMTSNELYEGIKNNTIQKGFCNTILFLLESYTIKLHKELDYKSKLLEEHEERYKEIRSLNIQNRELRKQLGEKVSAEDVREKIKNLEEKIKDWWNKEGFGYISDIKFNPFCCRIKLSGRMSMYSKEKQVDYLRKKGYIILETENGVFELAHSEKNIELLTSEVKKRFSSSKLSNINLSNFRNFLTIDDAEFIIYDLTDIENEN